MDGSCLCGDITYIVADDPELLLVCHCTHCQRQTGSAFSLLYGAQRSGVQVSGNPTTYADKGDSGADVDRLFCPRCGSCILANAALLPHISFLFGGTLNDRSRLAPNTQIFCDSAQPWLHLTNLESHARLPPEEDG